VGAEGAGRGAVTSGAAVGSVDWAQVIRARLAGSQPQHDPTLWRVPGSWDRATLTARSFLPDDPTPAAVLIGLVEHPELTVLLTQRAGTLRHHAGQISFPGGSIEPGDAGPAAAALREAHEEIGLDPGFCTVIGYLPDHLVITGFLVTPVVALVRPGFTLQLDRAEVQDTFEVPVSHVFDPANHRPVRRRSHFTGEEVEFIDIPYGERVIWGATSGMLMTLYRLCTGAGSA
jgi:8-oxo-dGTP pyrophosphatase MutT (NUDIX family)